MDLKFIKTVRMICVIFIWVGFLMKAWNLLTFGALIWGLTLLYSFSRIEQAYYAMLEQLKKERENGKDQE